MAVVADPEWLDLVASAGRESARLDRVPLTELKHAEAAVLRWERAWERIRGWRALGVSIGVIVVVDDDQDAPEDRQRLEPLVLLRRTDADGFREAMERLRVGEATSRAELASGVADFHRGVFERRDGAQVRLTGLEVRLLAYLAARAFRVVSRQELMEQVWGYRSTVDTRTVEVTIARLRKKILQDSVLTIRGEGYRVVRVVPPTTSTVAVLDAFRAAALSLRQMGRLQEAEVMLDLHVNHRRSDDLLEEARERSLRSHLLFVRGDLSGAEAAARRALEAATEAGDEPSAAGARVALAATLRGRDPHREIPGLLDAAWATFDRLDDDAGRTRVLAMRADVAPFAEQLPLVERALVTFERGRAQFAEGMATRPQYGALLVRAGHLRLQAGDAAGAARAYALAVDVHAVLGADAALAQSLTGVASAALELGDDAGGEEALERALPVYARGTNARAHAAALAFRAMIWAQRGDGPRAVAAAAEARARAGRHHTPETVLEDVATVAAALVSGDLDRARREHARGRFHDSNHPPVRAMAAWLEAALATDTPAWSAAAARAAAAMPSTTRALRWAEGLARANPAAPRAAR